jgi:hypothetical protein
MYSIKSPSRTDRLNLALKYSTALHNWRRDLEKFLDTDLIDTSMLITLFQRQRNVLNFAYWHALFLVHRPFLLTNVALLTRHTARDTSTNEQVETDQNVSECLKAALSIVELVNELVQSHQFYGAYWVNLTISTSLCFYFAKRE